MTIFVTTTLYHDRLPRVTARISLDEPSTHLIGSRFHDFSDFLELALGLFHFVEMIGPPLCLL